jgi:glycosyltransferase involved in cell wall biosynthesis
MPHSSSVSPTQKIVINGRFLLQDITGTQRYAREFVQALDDLLVKRPDLSVSILMPKPRQTHPPLPHYKHINIRQVGCLQGPPWEQCEMPFYLKADEWVLCLVNTAPALSLWQGRKIMAVVHSLAYLDFPQNYSLSFRLLYNLLMPWVMRYAKVVITVSNSEKEKILSEFPGVEPRFFAVQNGGFPDRFLPTHLNLALHNKTPTVLYVGSLAVAKNFQRLYRVAYAMVQRRNIRFIFVGAIGGGLKSNSISIPQVLKQSLVFTGQINDEREMVRLYQSASCFIFPSLYESSGLPPIEAMALGVPTVVSDLPALRERCGEASIYCNPHNDDSIKQCIEEVLDTPALQHSLREKGRERAAQLTWSSCVIKTLQHINVNLSED